MWFAPLKKLYREKWNNWYTFHERSNTPTGNAKSPGYVLSSQWINEIWNLISQEIITKSFVACGIHNEYTVDSNNNLQIRMDSLHSVLRTILIEKKIIQNSVALLTEDTQEDEIDDSDLFDIGFGEEDDRPVVPENSEDEEEV